MKKGLLLSVLLGICSFVYAQTEFSVPSITLTTTKTEAIELKFGCVESHTIYIDWGDGNPVETVQIADSATVYPKASSAQIYPTSVTGIPVNGGKIKVYADDIKFFIVDTDQQITEVDVTSATRLGYLKINDNQFTKIDLSKNSQLEYVNLDDNRLEILTLGNAPKLEQLLAGSMSIAKIKLTGCPNIVNVNLSDNKITTIDVSANTKMTTLVLTNNLLTSIDCSLCESLKYLRLSGNRFAAANSVIFPVSSTALTQVLLKDNYFKLSTLPVTTARTYTYYPQSPYPSPKEIALGGIVDLSSELKLQGLSTEEETTTYTWRKKKDNTALVAGTDYTEVSAGIFKFDKELSDTIYCVMATAAFPKFTGTTNFYRTELSYIISKPTITLNTTKADGVELQLGCATGHKVFIDWGDGVPVETVEINDSLAVFGQNTMKPTTVTGIPKGTIKIYGSDILYFGADGQELTAIDVSAATLLGVLKVPSNKLEKLSLTKNTELYYVYAEENNLSALNVSYAPYLIYLSAQKNKISSIDLSKNKDLGNLNLGDNLLTSIDISACEKMGTCRLGNNRLKEIKIPSNGTNPTMLDVKNNYLKISTLPDKTTGMTSASRYTYAPQKPYPLSKEIALGGIVDLSLELEAKGLSDKEETTTYAWRKKDNTLLVAGTDYTIEGDGIFKFSQAMEDSVYCIMTTKAFPKFVSPNFYRTNYAAVTDQPTIMLTTTKTSDVDLLLGCSESHKVFVDWGDGIPVETVEINDSLAVFGQATMKPTTVTGTPKNGGVIKIYANDILYFGADEQGVSALDVSEAIRLGVIKVPTNNLSELNLTNNTELYYVYAEENNLSTLDVTKAPYLIYLSAQKNKINNIDLSKNLDLGNLNLGDNLLASIDISACEKMGTCRLGNNLLEEIIVPSNGTNPTMLDVKNNKLKISTLPDKTTGMTSASRYTYVPQAPYSLPKDIDAGTIIDLSSELKAIGMSTKEETTTYTWRLKTSGTALQKDVDYTEENGLFKFTGTVISDSVYCVMATAAYPKFMGTVNMFKTTNVKITVPAGMEGNTLAGRIISTGTGMIKVLNAEVEDAIEVYTLSGALIAVRKASGNVEEIKVLPGSYIVKIGNERRSVIVP